MCKYSGGGNNYWNKNTVCPYYRRTTSGRIACEWMDEGEIVQIFESEQKKEEQLINYCSKQEEYQKCPLCMINDQFYQRQDE
ncbi:MAG: hypothetical protein GX786_00570 [Clostridiales bacterium]|nr:hypothetical protein [Clostridiales bacterium]